MLGSSPSHTCAGLEGVSTDVNVRDHNSETVKRSVWGREGGGVDSAINMAGSHTPSKDGKGWTTLPEMVTHMWHRTGLHSGWQRGPHMHADLLGINRRERSGHSAVIVAR